jgi:predicted RNase H-like nuclease (RuvC/YqgF family)
MGTTNIRRILDLERENKELWIRIGELTREKQRLEEKIESLVKEAEFQRKSRGLG